MTRLLRSGSTLTLLGVVRLGQIEEAEPLLLRGVHGLLKAMGPADFRAKDAVRRALAAFEGPAWAARAEEVHEAVKAAGG